MIMAVATNEDVRKIVERKMGMTIHSVKRQARWRPAWFIEGERDGHALKLVVRGERVDTFVQPLREEVKFHQLLEDHGIAVPHIHCWIDELDAVVLEMVPGKPDFAGVPDATRDTVIDEYLQELVRMHQLPIDKFVEAGVMRASSPQESGMVGHLLMERLFRAKKRHPHPFMEFCLGWLHRNPPRSHGREAAIAWDSGQFHHHNGHMNAVLDLEFGHLGDPMLDLTVWRMRETILGFGDFRKLYARYGELAGAPVDIEAIKLHHFAATIGNELMFGPAVLNPVPDTDLMNNMQWDSETNLHATEALAEILDLELPTVEVPEPRRTRSAQTYKHLINSLKTPQVEDADLRHDLRLAFRTVRHLERVAEIGDAVVEADLDDMHKLLGHRPATWWEGDAELERFVLADARTGKHDEALIWLFHRRNLRAHMQMGPPGSKMVAHYPVQRFDGVPPVNTATFGGN
jgi:aminoglycoside phosphotransferase (APT) family kinase protein